MYAIFETGGKQYKTAVGDKIRVEKLPEKTGGKYKFDKVLAFSDGTTLKTGEPYIAGASVNAVVTKQGKADKVVVFKFKAKKDYRKKRGHRQQFTEVEIDGFTVDGKTVGDKPAKAEKAEAKPKAEKAAKPAAAKKPAASKTTAKKAEKKAEPKE